MPELPEVETVRRGLQPVLEGALIRRVELRRPNLRFPFDEQFASRLENRRIDEISRRAKYLLIHVENGPVVIAHLGMSGSFRIERQGQSLTPEHRYHAHDRLERHDHVIFEVTGADGSESRVIYNDPRRFGFMLLCEADLLADHKMMSSLGMEPTGNRLDGSVLGQLLKGRKTTLKAALMDQRIIAGLGNIYVCEALWRARLSPMRKAGTLAVGSSQAKARASDLALAIRDVISDAIEAGGSTLRDHRLTDGSLGYFQHRFSVYDREGQECLRKGCNSTVHRIVQNGRSTFFCPACQN